MAKSYKPSIYGEVCEHIKELRKWLEEHGIEVWSEHGEPEGWVNVSCPDKSHHTYECLLRKY